jgi:hypothetical protein
MVDTEKHEPSNAWLITATADGEVECVALDPEQVGMVSIWEGTRTKGDAFDVAAVLMKRMGSKVKP